MKIVAFLQNQWFKDPEKIQKTIQRSIDRARERGGKTEDEVRDCYIAAFLFFGCMTGRRLQVAFGDLCEKIIWQEQSPQIGGTASSAFPPDHEHIRRSLKRHEPTHVIALGKLAAGALTAIHQQDKPFWKLITGPHPAARQADVMQRLKLIPQELT